VPSLLILLLAFVAILLAVFGSIRTAFVVLVAVHSLVPGDLVIPNTFTGTLGFHRVVLGALLLRVLIAWWRGEIDSRSFRPASPQLLFAPLLIAMLVAGVFFAPGSSEAAVLPWLRIFDQLAFLVAVLAAMRAINDLRWVTWVVVAGIGAQSFIGVVEHFGTHGWNHFWFEHLPSQQGAGVGSLLRTRGGVRVRSNASFSLEFSWLGVIGLPLALAAAATAGRSAFRWLARIIPILLILGIAWSTSRSSLFGLGVVAVALVVGTWRERRVRVAVVVAIVGSLGFWFATPGLRNNFANAPKGSIDERANQLPRLLEAVSHVPYTGIGIGNLRSYGFQETDSSYLSFYSQAGVFTLAAFLVLLFVTVVTAGWALRAPPSFARAVGIATLAGLLAAIAGAFAYDLFNVTVSSSLVWLLVALNLAARTEAGFEPAPQPVHRATLVPAVVTPVVLMATAAVICGIGLRTVAPKSSSATVRVQTINPATYARAARTPIQLGNYLGNTTCDVTRWATLSSRAARSRCAILLTSTGDREIWIGAAHRRPVEDALRLVRRTANVMAVTVIRERGVETGPPTVARTAPLWLPFGAVAILLFAIASRREYGTGKAVVAHR